MRNLVVLRGTVAGAEITLQASIGVACSLATTDSADELVGDADAAMYQSKHEGAGRVVLYEPPSRPADVETAT